ncbi:MAG TPA: serine hydrolase domain-containing protein [Pseudonocardiaceae bacterium]
MNTDELMRPLRAAVRARLGAAPGAVLAISQGNDVHIETVGSATLDGDTPLSADTVFRISSMTKPLVAALAMMLVEDGVFGPADPVERWLPELANRRVLRSLGGTDTEPAERPITVDDVLTMRMGFGFVFDEPCPTLELAARAGLGIGPPDPANPLTPDEWIARFAELPLLRQPGADWMYDLAYGVLGVLIARAAGRPLDELLHERLLAPLGMTDTGFTATDPARLIPCYQGDGTLFDPVDGSRWANRPAFPDPRGGLVATARDYLRFANLLLRGGVTADATRLLSAGSVTAMTTNRLTKPTDSFFLTAGAWGYGMEVITTEARYGWGGGLGTTWYSYPDRDLAVVLLTQCLPPPEPLVDAFWSTLHSLL